MKLSSISSQLEWDWPPLNQLIMDIANFQNDTRIQIGFDINHAFEIWSKFLIIPLTLKKWIIEYSLNLVRVQSSDEYDVVTIERISLQSH
jgi:hypothetical protein